MLLAGDAASYWVDTGDVSSAPRHPALLATLEPAAAMCGTTKRKHV